MREFDKTLGELIASLEAMKISKELKPEQSATIANAIKALRHSMRIRNRKLIEKAVCDVARAFLK